MIIEPLHAHPLLRARVAPLAATAWPAHRAALWRVPQPALYRRFTPFVASAPPPPQVAEGMGTRGRSQAHDRHQAGGVRRREGRTGGADGIQGTRRIRLRARLAVLIASVCAPTPWPPPALAASRTSATPEASEVGFTLGRFSAEVKVAAAPPTPAGTGNCRRSRRRSKLVRFGGGAIGSYYEVEPVAVSGDLEGLDRHSAYRSAWSPGPTGEPPATSPICPTRPSPPEATTAPALTIKGPNLLHLPPTHRHDGTTGRRRTTRSACPLLRSSRPWSCPTNP